MVPWVVLLLNVDRNFLHTFYSTKTGKQECAHRFMITKNDDLRAKLLDYHPSFYKAFEDELEKLIKAKWTGWMLEDRPEWLTEKVISAIPDHMLPVAAVLQLKVEGGGERRRSAGSVRESMGVLLGGGGEVVNAAAVAPNPTSQDPNPV